MFKINSYLLKSANISIDLSPIESKICNYIQLVCNEIPLLSNNKFAAPTARIAGGWTRDKLLGLQSKDIDVTIDNMTGEQFANFLQTFDKQRGINVTSRINTTEARPEQIKNLAVAFTKIYDQDVEILNIRAGEVYAPGSRNPISTRPGTPQEDAFRRDLTINSLFYNINTGQVEDFTGKGIEDLGLYNKTKTIVLRTPLEPKQTFLDDPLRLLRVLRFHSKYNNSVIAQETVESMKDQEVQNHIARKIINPKESTGIVTERVSEELRKIMSGEQPEMAIRIMYDTGLLHKLLNLPKEFNPLNMNQQNKHHQLSLIDHTIEVIRNVNKLSKKFGLDNEYRAMMNIAALFHDLGKLDPRSHVIKPDGTRGYSGSPDGLSHQQSSADVWTQFAKALNLSNQESEFIGDVVLNHMNPHGHIKESPSDRQLRKYLRKNPSWFFQYIHAMADAQSKQKHDDNGTDISAYQQNIERMRALYPNIDQFGKQPPHQDILNGHEIMNIVGKPARPPKGMRGSYIDAVKERLREAQDENPLLTKEQATQIVYNMISSGELSMYNV